MLIESLKKNKITMGLGGTSCSITQHRPSSHLEVSTGDPSPPARRARALQSQTLLQLELEFKQDFKKTNEHANIGYHLEKNIGCWHLL